MSPSRMSDLYIEKRRLPVTLSLRGGRRVDGEIFVQANARARGVPEGVPEFMNSADPFFPVLLPDSRVSLIAKPQLVAVQFRRDLLDESLVDLGEPAEAAVTMDDGTTFCGQFYLSGIPSHRRVLDHLNHSDDSFLALIQEERVALVARAHIVQVSEPPSGTV